MENSFKSIIDQSKSVLILLPVRPYFDQLAAGLALYLSLRDKKEVQIYSPTPMTVDFNRLIGVNRVSQELGNKNLIIRFVDYRASDIERVSYDIEDSQFKLSVIPKVRISPPTKEQVELSYSGVSSDCVIMIGGANESHFPVVSSKELAGANLIHIGTKDLSLSGNLAFVSFAKPLASVSEVVTGLIKESGLSLDEDISTNLLMGIENATDNFTTPSVSAETFLVVAELMKAGGKRMSAQVSSQPAYSPGAIPGVFPRAPFTQVQPVQQTQTWQAKQQQQQAPVQQKQEEPEEKDQPPQDWLQPKIYKGTSVS